MHRGWAPSSDDAGDHALPVMAETLSSSLRKTDLIARLGGDEFAILLAETDEAAARKAGSHVRRRLLDAMDAHGWPITFSSGAVTFRAPPASADESIMIADALRYEVKARGKNHTQNSSWPPHAAEVESAELIGGQ